MGYWDELQKVAAANLEEIESDLAQVRLAAERSRGDALDLERQALRLEALRDLAAKTQAAEQAGRKTLYEAMAEVIERSPLRMMRAADIATEINRRRLYQMQDGRPVEPQQIRVRVGKRPDLFAREGTFVKVVES